MMNQKVAMLGLCLPGLGRCFSTPAVRFATQRGADGLPLLHAAKRIDNQPKPIVNSNIDFKQVTLRDTRPEWDSEWRGAKTGGPMIHRRHCLRSGLIKQALESVFDHSLKNRKMPELIRASVEILQNNYTQIETAEEVEFIINNLYSRLHNNHLNIFLGRGSYNQMLGTLAHGLEKTEEVFLASLSLTNSLDDIEKLVYAWCSEVIAYAMCKYMEFTEAQERQVRQVVTELITECKGELDSKAVMDRIDALELFESPERNDSPMEIMVHHERLSALAEGAVLLRQRIGKAFDGFDSGNGHGVEPLIAKVREDIQAVVLDTLDSANFDISEAANLDIRKLQNSIALRASIEYAKIVEEPDVEHFARVSQDFLRMEQVGAEILSLDEDYRTWFSQKDQRMRFIEAITSDKLVPTLESAKYNPRQWKSSIRQQFKLKPGEQRVQVVSTILIRQAAQSVSNFAFSTGRDEEIFRSYERLSDQKIGSINDVETLKAVHAKLLNRLHNIPANIYIGRRGDQIAFENMAFSLESTQTAFLKMLRQSSGIEELNVVIDQWRCKVTTTAIAGYLQLLPSEEKAVYSWVEQAYNKANPDQFRRSLLTNTKRKMHVYKNANTSPGAPLSDRYPRHQIISFREKIEKIIKMSADIKERTDALIGEKCSLIEKQAAAKLLLQQLITDITIQPSGSKDPVVRENQNSLLVHAAALQALRKVPEKSDYEAIIPRFETAVMGLLSVDGGKKK